METRWVKSSFCSGGSCVEAKFVKSTRSTAGACVESGVCEHGDVLVRDSKDQGGQVHSFSRGAWNNFLDAIASGEIRP